MYIDVHFKSRAYQKGMASWKEREAKQTNTDELNSRNSDPKAGSQVPAKTLSVETVNFQDPEVGHPNEQFFIMLLIITMTGSFQAHDL